MRHVVWSEKQGKTIVTNNSLDIYGDVLKDRQLIHDLSDVV